MASVPILRRAARPMDGADSVLNTALLQDPVEEVGLVMASVPTHRCAARPMDGVVPTLNTVTALLQQAKLQLQPKIKTRLEVEAEVAIRE
jgi:hypothetical protein